MNFIWNKAYCKWQCVRCLCLASDPELRTVRCYRCDAIIEAVRQRLTA